MSDVIAVRDTHSMVGVRHEAEPPAGRKQHSVVGDTARPLFAEEWETILLGELEKRGDIRLYRGNVISQKDIDRIPGDYPIYSSSVHADGLFGSYGDYMFDEKLITWSVDGGGHFFYRPKHKFSVTNVCGYLRIRTSSIDYRYLAYHLQGLHSRITFDYTLKAHPSVIRGSYTVALPQPSEQRAIASVLSDADELIGSLEALIAKKRAIKQAAMQGLLTGRTRLPGFEGEWEVRRLGDHLRFLRHGTNSRSDLTMDGTMQYLHYGDIHTSAKVYLDPTVTPMPTIATEHAKKLDRLDDGDLVFVDASEDIEGVGKSVELRGLNDRHVVSGLHTHCGQVQQVRPRRWIQGLPTVLSRVSSSPSSARGRHQGLCDQPCPHRKCRTPPPSPSPNSAPSPPSSPTWTPRSPPSSTASTRPARSSRV